MKEYHKKFNSLNNLKPRTKYNEKLKQEVLTNVGDLYNEQYDIYKSKYNKKIGRLVAKNKKKFDYKKLRLSDNHQCSYEEEQEEEQEKQDEKTTDPNEFNEQIIKKQTQVKNYLKIILSFKDLVICSSFCTQQKIKQKTMNQLM